MSILSKNYNHSDARIANLLNQPLAE